jgi:hypothetical protein
VKIDETAMSSAELAEVTAMKTIRSTATAPPPPRSATAAYGTTRPADTSAGSMRFGKVGNAGFPSSAKAARPQVVAMSQGMANQEIPPMM